MSIIQEIQRGKKSFVVVPKIDAIRIWSPSKFREACVANRLYTRGDNEAYSRLLEWVWTVPPTLNNLYLAAEDICEHSAYSYISNVMYILENETVVTFYDIEDELKGESDAWQGHGAGTAGRDRRVSAQSPEREKRPAGLLHEGN